MSKLSGKEKSKQREKLRKYKNYQNETYKKDLIKQIRTFGDPVLKEKCTPVDDYEAFKPVLKLMAKILAATDNGVGLAASQIGITKNAFVMRLDTEVNSFKFCVNPEIVEFNLGKEVTVNEGCLSFPGIFVKVKRNDKIAVKYLDEHFVEKKEIIEKMEAYIFAHEYSHTIGVCENMDEWERLNPPKVSILDQEKAKNIISLSFNADEDSPQIEEKKNDIL